MNREYFDSVHKNFSALLSSEEVIGKKTCLCSETDRCIIWSLWVKMNECLVDTGISYFVSMPVFEGCWVYVADMQWLCSLNVLNALLLCVQICRSFPLLVSGVCIIIRKPFPAPWFGKADSRNLVLFLFSYGDTPWNHIELASWHSVTNLKIAVSF